MIEVVEPATEQVMAEVPRAGAEEVDAAVAAAKAAFPAWRAVAPADRAACCTGSPTRSRSGARSWRRSRRATPASRSPTRAARSAMVVETFRYYAGAPERLLGETIPVAGGVDMTFREPLGVVGLIVPWNFPLVIASWKVAPALAAGNTVVLKPAELTPLTALELERIALEAGLPEGVLNVVAGPGQRLRQRLVEHPDVAKIAFTGSTEVGRGIAAGAAADDQAGDARARRQVGQRGLRRRRPRAAAAAAPIGGLRQRRPGLLRALADPRRALGARPFLEALERGGRGDAGRRPARRGDADGAADLGRPARDGRLVRPRRRAGRDPRLGARRARASGSRRPCSRRCRTTTAPPREEIFGPVACVIPFDGEDEAIADRQRHDLRAVGLDLDRATAPRALRVARAIETGVLSINSNTSVRVSTPFGGFKQSGVGRELGPDALEHYTEVKNVFYATEGAADGGTARRQGLRDHRRGERHRRRDGAAVRARRARRSSASTSTPASEGDLALEADVTDEDQVAAMYERVASRARPHRRALQQRRHQPDRRHLGARDRARGLAAGAGRQPAQRLPLLQARDPAPARAPAAAR